MAGNYPNVPSWRIPYDRDGTIGMLSGNNVTFVEQSDAWINNLNSESMDQSVYMNTGTSHGSGWLALIFPRLMDIDGWMIAETDDNNISFVREVLWSPDTTNGADGTWVSAGDPAEATRSLVAMRTQIDGASLSGVRALKFAYYLTYNQWGYIYNIHLYGEPTPGEDTNKLEIVPTTSESRVGPAYFDFGDVPRLSENNKQFRVKNLSATQTANDIIVALDVPTDATPSFDAMHTFQYGSSGYLPQINIGTLLPGEVSPTIDIRQLIDSNAKLGLQWARITASATTWSQYG